MKIFKSVDFETISLRILFGVIFLLPLFAFPFGIFPVDFNKAMFLYVGVSISAIFFLLSRLQKGSIIFPKSFLLASLFFVAFAWVTTSIFSGHIALSLTGTGYEIGTSTFFIFLAFIAFLVPALFRRAEHLALLYKAIFASALVLFVVQVLHTGFGTAIPPWGMFQGRLASVLGDWNDVGIFFGLIVLLSLSSIEFPNENKKGRAFLWTTLTASLIVVFFINFSTLQYVLGFSVLALLVYRLVKSEKLVVFSPPFFVFLAVIAFSVAHEWIGSLINFLGIQFTQVSPAWSATIDVIKGALSMNPLIGSGPNTFSYDWLMFKPDAISATPFWDARFQSGIGKLLSMVAETGLLGGTALAVFIFSLLYTGKKVASHKDHGLETMLLASSFLGSVYLWIFTIVYSPGFYIFFLAGIFTGVFIASLVLTQNVSMGEIVLAKGTKKGFALHFVFAAIIISFAYSTCAFVTKYLAGYFYTTGLTEASLHSNADKADAYLQKAIQLDPQDVYFRSSAEVNLFRLGQMVMRASQQETVSDVEKTQFRSLLTRAVQSAKSATAVNPLDPENWMELGRTYEAIIQFDPNGFKSSAIFAYKEALRVSPHSPLPLLALARVELQTKNPDGALGYLKESIKIKNDFIAGHIMIAEVSVQEGKLKDAIAELERTVIADPNNPENIGIILRIGVLYYQDGDYNKAQKIFENLISMNPNYAEARYALGVVYDKKGMTSDAIAQFEAIHAIFPNNEEIQTILSNLRSGRDTRGNVIAPTPAPEAPIGNAKKGTRKKLQ